MRDKKGVEIVGEHVINIIVAVLCILVLIYLGIQVYNFYLGGKQELKQAEFTLEMISGVVDVIQEGEKIEKVIVNPKGWYLINYSDMLCLCENEALLEGKENCCKKGASSKIEKKLRIESICSLPIKDNYDCISFEELPRELLFFEQEDSIILKTKEDLILKENLEKLLQYKKDENSKTVRELILEYIGASDDKAKLKIREQIGENIISFLSSLNTKSLFGVERKNFGWWLKVEKKDGTLFLNLPSLNHLKKEELISLSTYEIGENNEYLIKLGYYKGEYDATGGYDISGP